MSHPFPPKLQISSKHCQTQSGRARELKFWENVHPTLCVMCHVSCVTCYLLRVTYQSTFFKPFFYNKKEEDIFFPSLKNFTKWWSWLMEGLLSTGPTPSSLNIYIYFIFLPLIRLSRQLSIKVGGSFQGIFLSIQY